MCTDQKTEDKRPKTDCYPRQAQAIELAPQRRDNRRSSVFGPLSSERGVSLVELVMFIVIVSSALAGILLVMNQTTQNSADPLVRKQAIAAAYSLLEEIQLQDFTAAAANVVVTQANRASAYHIVSDYNGFATAGIYTVNGVAPIPGLENYSAAVAVTPQGAWNGIAAGNVVQITVTVTSPNGEAIAATGYRAKY